MVCVDESAHMTGTLGGGCMEASVRRDAHQTLAKNESTLLTFKLDSDFGYDDGMICGGQIDVAVCTLSADSDTRPIKEALERIENGQPADVTMRVRTDAGPVEYRVNIEPAPKLIIAGGGHIGRLLAEMMIPLGFGVSVLDDRVEFANAERFPDPIKPVVGDIGKTLATWPIDANTYIVIVTRGHNHDEQALGAVLASPAKYIGMIGSRRKVKVIFDDLLHAGATQEQVERVHAPIGVAINSVTAPEIALSIAAQLVSVRRADHKSVVEGPLPAADAPP